MGLQPLLLLFLSMTVSVVVAQIGTTCFESGSCLNSNFVTFTKADDSNHCLFDCQANANATGARRCEWFTYYPSTGYCLQFANCTTLAVSPNCTNCISGEDECSPVYECEVENLQCQATTLNSTFSFSVPDCLDFCKTVPGCEWYTYNTADSICVAFSDCMNRVTCPVCVSGENDCTTLQNVLNEKMMVVGGLDTAMTEVEVIDTTGQYNCSQPRDLTIGLSGACGVYIGGRVLVCGGQTINGTISNSCYAYNATGNTWILQTFRLLNVRMNAACIKINEDTWWITGGSNNDNFYSTTEYFHAHTNTFTVGPVLPRPLAYHCITQIDATRFMVVGGASVGTLTTASIYDYANHQWQTRTPLPSGRYGHFCGTVVSRNSTTGPWVIEVVAAGGSQRNTHVYSLSTNSWRVGAVHPLDNSFGSSVAFGQSFLTVGGDSLDLSIYNYNISNSGTWVNTNLKLRYPRVDSAAFPIPNDYFSCGETL